MEIRLLGPLEVVDARGAVDVGSRRQRALLALLALHPNRVVTSERILDALWGEDAMDKENAMWVAISRLRSALEPDHAPGAGSLVVTRGHGYVLAVDPDDIDITHFEAAIDAARGLSEHDSHAALDKVDEALALWRGSPIEEFGYEDFAQVEIARLEDRHLEALELRAESQLRLGNGREQLAPLEALHREHPLRERFVELLMSSLYQVGRQADALRVFDSHRRAFADETGLDVSPELARLEEQILLHDPVVRVLRRAEATANPATITNPFKGLRAFSEDDVEDFFGRDRLVSDIVRRLGDERTLLAVVGASGSGKSSMVGAGVIPALRKGALPGSENWLIAKMLPGAHPMAALESALLRSSIDVPDSLADQLSETGTGLLRAALRILPEGACLLLVIDQFEELFTLVDDEGERARFLDLLGPALDDPHRRVRVLLTLRADFYERPLAYPAFAQRLSDRILNVSALAPEEFEAAAMEPMRRAGVAMEPALLASLLTDVVGQPGALPLFQYTLTTLFESRADNTVTLADYRARGGLRGALTERADELMAQLSKAEQRIARQLFLRLVTITEDGEWSRRRVAASELVSLPLDLVALQHVIEVFNSQRLLASDRDHLTGSPTIEVAHEALISQWPRFKGWIDEDVQGLQLLTHLRDASHGWEVGGEDTGDLYRGARLEVVLDWADTRRPVLSDMETRFLDGSREARDLELESERRTLEQRERQNRRLRRMLVVAATTAVAALVFGALALQQRQRASEQTQQALAARTVAETRRLAADAPALAPSNSRVALLMAAEAYRRDPSAGTLGALQRVFLSSGNLVGYLGQTPYERAMWSPDGLLVLGLRPDAIDIFDFETGVQLNSISIQAGNAMDISPGGDRLAVATASTQVQVFDLPSGEPVGQPIEHGSNVQAIRFSPDGATLATGDRSGVLRLFGSRTLAPVLDVDAHRETDFLEANVPSDVASTADHEPTSFPLGVREIAFTPDSSVIATTGGVFIRTWSAADGKSLTDTPIDRPSSTTVGRFVGRPTEIVLASNGEAVVRTNRFIQRWDLETDELIYEYGLALSNESGILGSLGTLGAAFGEDRLAVADLDIISIIDTSDAADAALADRSAETTAVPLLAPFDIQAGSTTANAQFSPDARTVAVAGTGGIVLWAVDGRELLGRAVPNDDALTGSLQVSSDGGLLLVGSRDDAANGDGSVWLLDGDQAEKLELPVTSANRMWLDLPGHLITQTALLLEVLEITSLETTGVNFGQINNFNLAVDPAGDTIAIAAGTPDEPFIHVFRIATGQRPTAPIDLKLIDLAPSPSVPAPFGLAFNSDGTRLLVSTRSGAAAVFDTRTWERIGELISQGAGRVLEAAYSSDGRFLATSDSTGAITLRDPATHQPLGRQFVGPTAGVTSAGFHSLAFSTDGQYIVSTADRTVRMWDVETGELVGSPIEQDGRPNIAASLNARFVPVKRQNHVLVYDLDVTRWFDIACRAAGRNFTVDEWQQSGPADADPQQTCPQWAPSTEAEGG